MTKKMIIDASHPEETRVALIGENNRLTDFDFESTTKQTVKGNIYLAKVMRVEPSLQAAFIEYGGNRHGFLAFSEIHPDYFRIPVSDREALKAEMQSIVREENEEVLEEVSLDAQELVPQEREQNNESLENLDILSEVSTFADMPVDSLGGESVVGDEDEILRPKTPLLHQMYKIQEVIQRHQILLVQVIKEERGGKGAALSTFLSLAGRYGVLMPNSPRSGGISRKISNQADRSRLKKVLEELAIPEGMGLIIRTAGRERTKVEIKRDAEFLMRAWNGIRDLTLQSIAPALVYEEDDIIKRAIRDLYTKDVDEILVEGEEGYKIARSFMKTLMPSHLKRVQHYKDPHLPLFNKFRIENQIDEMHTPFVHLPSGGSIVIHPTEALVSIDINSGRSTRERHIEETAVKTNLEAADEIARQVRLRDLAGLVVIDFIDMDDHRHVSAVERRLREAFRYDRARIQMGKIGPFGLLELSRQRLRPSILETSAHPCPHCHATGYIRSTESTSLYILRQIEEEALSGKASEFQIHVPLGIAFYLLNAKREHLQRLETHLQVKIYVEGDDQLISPQYRITRLKRRTEEGNDGSSMLNARRPLSSGLIESNRQEEEEEKTQVLDPEEKKDLAPSEGRNRNRRRRRSQRNRNNPSPERTNEGSQLEKDAGLELRPASEQPPQREEGPSKEESARPEDKESSSSTMREGNSRKRFRSRRNKRPHSPRPEESEEGLMKEPTESSSKSPDTSTLEIIDIKVSSHSKGFESEKTYSVSQDQGEISSEEGNDQKKKSKGRWWKRLLEA